MSEHVNIIFEEVIIESLKKELEIIMRTFEQTIASYSFLQQGDIGETKEMLIKAIFEKNKELFVDDEFQFNKKIITEMTPNEVKEKLVANIIFKFGKNVNIHDLVKEGD